MDAPWSLFMFLRLYLLPRLMRGGNFSGGAHVLGRFANFDMSAVRFSAGVVLWLVSVAVLCWFMWLFFWGAGEGMGDVSYHRGGMFVISPS
jgi:hypothetical protein